MRCADLNRRGSAARLSVAVLVAAFVSAGGAAPSAAADGEAEPAAARPLVLDRPAQQRSGAERQLLLAVAPAGKRLVAVGANGHVVISDDGGVRWRQARSVPTSATLTGVKFSTARDGWAIGHLGVVLETHDAGETWQTRMDGVKAAKLMLDAAEQMAARDGSDANLLQLKFAKLAVKDGPNKPFLTLRTDGPNHALVLGAFGLGLETQDDGKTWTPLLDRMENPRGFHYYGMARGASSQVIVGEQGLLLYSQDGKQFKALQSPYAGTLFGVAALPGGSMVGYGLRGNVVRSGDGGATWTKVESGVPASVQAAAVLPGGTLVLASESGQLIASTDGGQKFSPLTSHIQPAADLLPVDAKTVLVVGPRGAERVDLSAQRGIQ